MTRATDGSGISAIERLVGGLLLKRWVKRCPPEVTLEISGKQSDEFASMARRVGESATQRVRVKRLPGLEVSSTNYSIAMTIEHVGLVNRGLAELLSSLREHGRFETEVRTADYKPRVGVGVEEALETVQDAQERLADLLADLGWLGQGATHPHPWFGELPARVWACFPGFHGQLHLKQAVLIERGL